MHDGVLSRLIYVEVTARDADVLDGEPLLTAEKIIGVTTSGTTCHSVKNILALL